MHCRNKLHTQNQHQKSKSLAAIETTFVHAGRPTSLQSGCAGAVKWLCLRLEGRWVRCSFLAALCWARARDVQTR